ncbi:MAG: V-type ATP synthase subunit A [candidate division WOR-3 bacterium]
MNAGRIVKVSGPLVVAEGLTGSKMYDMVRVSEKRLLGEIIQLQGDEAAIQVYEDTTGIGVGEPVYPTFEPLSVELGPGLLETIYDGIQRPLDLIQKEAGNFITRGIEAPALSRERYWHFVPLVEKGTEVSGGDILGEVAETILVKHRIMVPPGISGKVIEIKEGNFLVTDVVALIEEKGGKTIELTMMQRWPVRQPRPVRQKLPPIKPLITGQRIIDTFFLIAKGGTACVPGPFGSGKTVIQHQLAKWSDAEIVIFVGCGERGNEMTDVLIEFPKLKDPKSGEPLMKRTVLIANTSNMPVAAREASVYTAITIGEYFRDMGYSVALQADSTSRWAEAMREISGRLEEMPGEEGYPAYLATRIAEFYERAGRVVCLGKNNGKEMEGTLTVIGSVSPPGGDLNDPVVQATLRVVKVFWSLEDKLAFRRHFPAISWLRSYSLYTDAVGEETQRLATSEFPENARRALALLQKEAELEEIVRLVGKDTLSPQDRLVLETARSIREDYLHQNAFDETDTYTSLKKQAYMLSVILYFYDLAQTALAQGADINEIERLPVRERIARMKFLPEEEIGDVVTVLKAQIESEIKGVTRK